MVADRPAGCREKWGVERTGTSRRDVARQVAHVGPTCVAAMERGYICGSRRADGGYTDRVVRGWSTRALGLSARPGQARPSRDGEVLPLLSVVAQNVEVELTLAAMQLASMWVSYAELRDGALDIKAQTQNLSEAANMSRSNDQQTMSSRQRRARARQTPVDPA